jgi:tetratricopeptide (TPR) repeat protein
VKALYNRANILHELRRFDESLATFAQTLALAPDYAEAQWNEGLTRLLLGDFERGWQQIRMALENRKPAAPASRLRAAALAWRRGNYGDSAPIPSASAAAFLAEVASFQPDIRACRTRPHRSAQLAGAAVHKRDKISAPSSIRCDEVGLP